MMKSQSNYTDDDPEYSVRMSTDAGWVFLAEFRTHGEAIALAREAAGRLDTPINVWRCGDDLQQVVPEYCAADVH